MREGLGEYPYLLFFMNLWPVSCKNQLKMMNMKVEKDNGKALGIVNGHYQKYRRFSSNAFWRNIGCLISDPTFGIGDLILWEKEEEIQISGKKSKRRSIG